MELRTLQIVVDKVPSNVALSKHAKIIIKLGTCHPRGALVYGVGLLSQGLRLSGTERRFTHSSSPLTSDRKHRRKNYVPGFLLSPPVQFARWAHMHHFLSVVCPDWTRNRRK